MRNIFLISVLSLFVSCSGFQVYDKYIAQFIPRETDVPGWELLNEPVSFREDYLRKNHNREFNHGAYLMASALYRSLSQPKVEFRVEIFKFTKPLDAFGNFSIERSGHAFLRNLKADYYTTDNGLFSRFGEYYIRILHDNIDDKQKQGMDTFLRVIQDNMEKFVSKDSIPEYLTLFSDNYSRDGLIYYRNGLEVIPGLTELYVRKVTFHEESRNVFFRYNDSAESAENLFEKVIKSQKQSFISGISGSLKIAFNKRPDGRIIFITWHKKWIFGILDAENPVSGGNSIIKLRNKLLN